MAVTGKMTVHDLWEISIEVVTLVIWLVNEAHLIILYKSVNKIFSVQSKFLLCNNWIFILLVFKYVPLALYSFIYYTCLFLIFVLMFFMSLCDLVQRNFVLHCVFEVLLSESKSWISSTWLPLTLLFSMEDVRVYLIFHRDSCSCVKTDLILQPLQWGITGQSFIKWKHNFNYVKIFQSS